MLVTQLHHFFLKVILHLLHAIFHMQDGLDACQVDTQVTHQATNMDNTLDIAIRVEAWTVRTTPLTSRLNQSQAFVMTQRLFVHLRFLCSHADDIPCAITLLRHANTLLSPHHECTSTPRLRASSSNNARSSTESCIGKTTLTRAKRLPLPSPRRCGIPLPPRRNVRLFCVSAGIVSIKRRPSGIGTGTSPPSIAFTSSTSTSA